MYLVLLSETLPAQLIVRLCLQLTHQHDRRIRGRQQFEVADRARRFQARQQRSQRGNERLQGRHQHWAGVDIYQPMRTGGAKPQVHLALAIHLDAQPCPAAIRRGLPVEQADGTMGQALPCQQLSDHLTFVVALGVERHMLQIAPSTLAKVVTGRRHAQGRGSQQGFDMRFIKAFAGHMDRDFHFLVGQHSVDEHGLPGSVVGHPSAIMGQPLDDQRRITETVSLVFHSSPWRACQARMARCGAWGPPLTQHGHLNLRGEQARGEIAITTVTDDEHDDRVFGLCGDAQRTCQAATG